MSIELTHSNPRVQRIIDTELGKLARATLNIERACEDGRISEHDRDERIARREQAAMDSIAHFTGQPRPAGADRHVSQPLDDPEAGRVG